MILFIEGYTHSIKMNLSLNFSGGIGGGGALGGQFVLFLPAGGPSSIFRITVTYPDVTLYDGVPDPFMMEVFFFSLRSGGKGVVFRFFLLHISRFQTRSNKAIIIQRAMLY